MVKQSEGKETEVKEVDGRRASWGTSFEFILSLLGYAVGMTNVLRFPYVCMKNGGGAFLIPYFTSMVICGVSLLFLEMGMGQTVRTGCITCWNHYAPVLKGVGYGMALLSLTCTTYYQICYGWILYYIYQSFTWDLPWSSCNNTWNTPACISSIYDHPSAAPFNSSYQHNNSQYYNNVVENQSNYQNIPVGNETTKLVSSTEEFFNNKVLGISHGIENFGHLQPHLVIAHIIGWIAIYVCVCKGVKSVGKVVYVTATAPYVFIIIFLIRAALLPGSLTGVKYFITPDFKMITKPDIWIQAFVQVFFSLGLGWGGIITMASYNKYHHPFYREALSVPFISSCTSLLCGFLVFSVAGFLAHVTGARIEDAVSSGPGLAFVSYPEAAAHLPGAPVWSILFFVMLIMIGADSQFVTFETCVSALTDDLKINRKHHIYVITGITLISLIIGLVFLSSNGMYIFQFIDWYIGICSVFVFAIFECLAVMWIYGYNRFYDDVEAMIGFRPLKYLLVSIVGVVIPVVIFISMVLSLLQLSPPTYGSYVYPSWVGRVGWLIGSIYTLPIFIVAISTFYKTKGDNFLHKIYLTCFPLRSHEQDDEKLDQTESFL